jgi:PEP-CTERM motif
MKMNIGIRRAMCIVALVVTSVSSLAQSVSASWSGTQDWIQATTKFNIGRGTTAAGGPATTWGGSGGEFRVYGPVVNEVVGPPVSEFYTFCVEINEYLASPSTVASIGAMSLQTNIPLSAVTSALYREFLRNKGTTTDFFGYSALDAKYNDVGSGSNNDAVRFQQAVWYFQGDQQNLNATQIANNGFIQAGLHWANTFNGGNTASLITGNVANFGGVRIMNLVNNSGAKAQDMLVYQSGPGGISVIPEPASISLFALGLAGFCGFSRRRRTVAE